MMYETPITTSDLHAWLDGRLSEQRQEMVEAWLAEHPEALREMRDYQAIGLGLHTLYDHKLVEPIPDRLVIRRSRQLSQRVAAVVAWIGVGIVLHWAFGGFNSSETQQLVDEQLVGPARFAHYVYTTDKSRPVEIKGSDERQLVSYLSERLRTQLKAPDLTARGYELTGGRLLPSTNRMAAQFMYTDKSGNRVTLYIRRIASVDSEAVFHFSKHDGINTLYWIEDQFGYAVSGGVEKHDLLQIAEITHLQFHTKK
ncbi:MAG: anti-sigma factor [Gammaproteobacteria bacterium]|nr:anti-sigma factor [Gammaproteobacteria bacterium]MDH5650592.1 anti-sigma factor [Gammaproteobacteria bacterium]